MLNKDTYKWHEFDKAEQEDLEIFCRAADNRTANHNMHKDKKTLSGQTDKHNTIHFIHFFVSFHITLNFWTMFHGCRKH